ncbi:MAG: anti-sigma factor antagonist, partial [Clostridia bacterium]|nr:anti-sigma factor antagonist [Clostridia bacterium]
MKHLLENETLKLFPEGKIDSYNAEETEREMNSIIDGNSFKDLILDADNLQYISSAGLRIILRLKKSHDKLAIINVNPEVYDIFEMTGFTEMMTIEKAYRKVSVEGCEVIGQGANGKIYRISEDTIVKVYARPDCLDEILNERKLAKKSFVLGIPTAISYDIAKV